MKKKNFLIPLMLGALLVGCGNNNSSSSAQPSSSSSSSAISVSSESSETKSSSQESSSSSEESKSSSKEESSSSKEESSSSEVDPLLEEKATAKAVLDSTNLAVYREAEKAVVSQIIVEGKAAIDAATTEQGIVSAKEEALGRIAAVFTDAQLTEMYTLIDYRFDICEVARWLNDGARIFASLEMPDGKTEEKELVFDEWTSLKGQVYQGASKITFLRYNPDKSQQWENTDTFTFNKELTSVMLHLEDDGEGGLKQSLVAFTEPARFYINMKVAVEGGENFAIAYHKSSDGDSKANDILELISPNAEGKLAPALKDGYDSFMIIRMPILQQGEVLSWDLITDGAHYWGGTPSYVMIDNVHPYFTIYNRNGNARQYVGTWTDLDTTFKVEISNEHPTWGSVETNADDLNKILPGQEVAVMVTPAEGYVLSSFKINETDAELVNNMTKFYVTGDTTLTAVFEEKPAVDPEELRLAKESAIAELDLIDVTAFSEAEKIVVNGIIAQAKLDIEAATEIATVGEILAKAKADIEAATNPNKLPAKLVIDLTDCTLMTGGEEIHVKLINSTGNKWVKATMNGYVATVDVDGYYTSFVIQRCGIGDPLTDSCQDWGHSREISAIANHGLYKVGPFDAGVGVLEGSFAGILPSTLVIDLTPTGLMTGGEEIHVKLINAEGSKWVNATMNGAVATVAVDGAYTSFIIQRCGIGDPLTDGCQDWGHSLEIPAIDGHFLFTTNKFEGGPGYIEGSFAALLPETLTIDLTACTNLMSGGEEIHVKLIGANGSKWVNASMSGFVATVTIDGEYSQFIIQRCGIGDPLTDGCQDWGHSLTITAEEGADRFVVGQFDAGVGVLEGEFVTITEKTLTIDFSQSEGIITGPRYEDLVIYFYNETSGANEFRRINVNFDEKVGTVKLPIGMEKMKIIRIQPTDDEITWDYINTHFWGGNVEMTIDYELTDAIITNGYVLEARP